MYYNSLLLSIPKQWKVILKTRESKQAFRPKNHNNLDEQIQVGKIKCKDLYWHFLTNKSLPPTCYIKWESDYCYANLDWKIINITPYKCARDTELQSTQYQIIHRFFPCNYILYKWVKSDTNTCYLCNEIDTLEHTLVHCENVKDFWKYLKKMLKLVTGTTLQFGTLDIIFGLPNSENDNILMVFNFIILLAKSYIKTCRRNKTRAHLYFQLLLKDIVLLEKQILLGNGHVDDFENNWRFLLENL